MSTNRIQSFDLEDFPLEGESGETAPEMDSGQQTALMPPALSVAMAFMRRLEQDLRELRMRVDEIAPPSRQIAAPAPPEAPAPAPTAEVEVLQAQLAARDLELERLRMNSPDAAMRIIEEQRDQARLEASNLRADLAIQAADLETKEALVTALEQALEQQQQSLRSLEERFAEYAARLQEIRFDRMQASLKPEGPEGAASRDSSPGLLALFKQVFSRPAKPAARVPRKVA